MGFYGADDILTLSAKVLQWLVLILVLGAEDKGGSAGSSANSMAEDAAGRHSWMRSTRMSVPSRVIERERWIGGDDGRC